MTDEEIIKALELCIADGNHCKDCPYGQIGQCVYAVEIDTLDLIKELKEKNESLDTLVLSYGDYVAKIRTEAINEFAERLKEESSIECDVSMGFGKPFYEDAIPIIAVDNLVKEMVGEEQCTNQK